MDSSSRQMFEELRTSIIPWAKAGLLRLVLARPPFQGADQRTLSVRAEPLLEKPEHYPLAVNPDRWPQLGLHACRYPCFGCVLDGETDISFGITQETVKREKTSTFAAAIAVAPMGARTLFLIPPGVPYSDASRPHWQRPDADAARARVLWITILPMGAMCHMSRTQGRLHLETAPILIRSPQLAVITHFLFLVVRKLALESEVVTSSLLTLLLSISEDKLRGHIATAHPTAVARDAVKLPGELENVNYRMPHEGNPVVIERACEYIQTNLIDAALSLPSIAHHSYISANQLERLFRSQLQTSVMKYVTERRLEEAKSLLTSTDISVQEVALLCGYPHRTHFSRLFAQHIGVSPRKFRERERVTISAKPRAARKIG